MNDTDKTTNDDGMDAINDGENRTPHNGADNMSQGHDNGMVDTDGDGKYRPANDTSATEAEQGMDDNDDSNEDNDDEGGNRPDQTGQ